MIGGGAPLSVGHQHSAYGSNDQDHCIHDAVMSDCHGAVISDCHGEGVATHYGDDQNLENRVHSGPSCKVSGAMVTKVIEQQQQKEGTHLHIMFPAMTYQFM
jgi:hypothetical protein